MSLPAGQAAQLAGLVRSVLDEILRRAQYEPDYPWLDTKLDTGDGSDLRGGRPADLFGRATVYPWIQGRGVEALALHARWCAGHGDAARAAACLTVARRVALALEQAHAAAGGRLAFWLDRHGAAFALAADGNPMALRPDPAQAGFGDLFHARGLAALALLDPSYDVLADARGGQVLAALQAGRFVSDQQPFDRRNRVGEVPGRRSFGPAMIALGWCALRAERAAVGAAGVVAVSAGLALVGDILARHANHDGRWPELPSDTLSEFIDADGAPWREAGHVLTDPGHACELVGLACWLFTVVRRRDLADPAQQATISGLLPRLARILARSFALGFNGIGLCKSWSLSAGTAVNDHRPWWSIPETMRAATLLQRLAPQLAAVCGAERILADCTRAFLAHYVNPRAHGWAHQTLDAAGRPVRVIPATPDADPGYHTGACLIAVLTADCAD